MSDLVGSPSGSPALAQDSSLTTPTTGKRGAKRVLMTPGTPDPGNGTLLGFPGMLDFFHCVLPQKATLSVPKTKKQQSTVPNEHGQRLNAIKYVHLYSILSIMFNV
jgi:hypothetical protein